MFLGTPYAAYIIFRFLISAVACRTIAAFELAGMKARNDPLGKSLVGEKAQATHLDVEEGVQLGELPVRGLDSCLDVATK